MMRPSLPTRISAVCARIRAPLHVPAAHLGCHCLCVCLAGKIGDEECAVVYPPNGEFALRYSHHTDHLHVEVKRSLEHLI